jgi:hypothetical protein
MSVAKVLDLIVAKGKEYTLSGDPSNAEEYAKAIIWHSAGSAPSWAEIEAGFIALEQEVANKAASKQALLDRLGITQEEANLLLG